VHEKHFALHGSVIATPKYFTVLLKLRAFN